MHEDKSPSKIKLFVENFLVYGLGGVISKIIPIIMLPIIARLMPDTANFGIADLANTATSFGCALAVIGMYDAMYRLFFEKDSEAYKKEVCSTTISFTAMMSIAVTVLIIACRGFIVKYFFKDEKYTFLVYIVAVTTLVSATNQIISAPTRMQNKRKVFLIINIVGPILSYAISIPLILKGYYVVALPVAGLISGMTTELVFWIINRKWFTFRLFNKKTLKQLLIIAIPLFPNFLIYWIFNSSDKLMVTNILNVGEEGIYAIGSKLGHVSQLIYTAFAGGWQYFAFSTMKEENQVKSNSLVFEYLYAISILCSFFVFSLSESIYTIFFPGEYTKGYIVAPYLFMAPLMQMLFQVASNQFLVIKKTWPNMFILLGGAILNIVLNFYLIPKIGIEGAAIATLLGYVFSDIIVCAVLYRMRLMMISRRLMILTSIIVAYILLWRLVIKNNLIMSAAWAIAASLCVILMYKKEFRHIYQGIFPKKRN